MRIFIYLFFFFLEAPSFNIIKAHTQFNLLTLPERKTYTQISKFLIISIPVKMKIPVKCSLKMRAIELGE